MKKTISILLISVVILFACQNAERKANIDSIAPIDSTSAATVAPIDSALVATDNSHENIVLPDSLKIYLTPSVIAESFEFSINCDKESTVELNPGRTTMTGKTTLSRTYSIQILRRISDVFLEHKAPVIISKKSHYSLWVEAEYPWIKFVIYSNGKTIETETIRVGDDQGFYEITYSDTFLELFNLLYTKAMALYELKK